MTAIDELCDLIVLLSSVHDPDSDGYTEDADAQRGYRERAKARARDIAAAQPHGARVECICPHQDANEPDHDAACPSNRSTNQAYVEHRKHCGNCQGCDWTNEPYARCNVGRRLLGQEPR